MFSHYQVGSLVNHKASKPYTLVGPPALQLVLDPLAVKLLDNRLYIMLRIEGEGDYAMVILVI